jgi:hypothetical protein
MYLLQKDIERFWKKVDVPEDWKEHPEKCWEWIGGLHGDLGYGQFFLSKPKKTTITAHRYSYQIYFGSIDNSELFVCHTCDNPKCVNPNHLFLGTAQDNNKDRDNKNRNIKGSQVNTSKFTEESVLEILSGILNNTYTNINQIKSKYNITTRPITKILKRLSWKHLTEIYDDETLEKMRCKIIGYLTENEVLDIKIRLNNNESVSNIAKIYKVYPSTIRDIKIGKTRTNI